MQRVFLLYALSGFLSLGYQVTWFRIFIDWFGSSSVTFALVVCNFIGGLGAGALLSQRMTRSLARRSGIRDRLRLYGLVELLVGGSALLTVVVGFLPADLWGTFPYVLDDGVWVQSLSYRVAELAIAILCVFLPCLFMGVTFPLLCETFRAAPGSERFPSALYAWNTLGACSGVLVCQFLLILWVGHAPTFLLMSGLNLALGVYFLASGGDPALDPPTTRTEDAPEGASGTRAALPISGFLAGAALSGLLAGALEGDLFKRIGFIITVSPGASMSLISFWAVLGIFLASSIVRRARWLRLIHIKFAFVLAPRYHYGLWLGRDDLTFLLSGTADPSEAGYFPLNLTQFFVYTGICVLPSYLLVSMLLPYVCNQLQRRGRHLGVAYGLNTVGFCLGLVGFTLIAPRVNIFYSLKLFMPVLAVGAFGVALISERRRVRLWQPILLGVLFLVAVVATPQGFDRSYFTQIMWPNTRPVRAMMADSAHTTFIAELPDNDARLFFGRLSMSGTVHKAQEYMRLMAHFPLLAHPNPKRALLICFGVGNTASAIATHGSIEQIDVIDLNRNVFRLAPELDEYHGSVHLDPRMRMIHDDGRHYLDLSDQRYDLITSEPPPPMAEGVYRLYSREYYEQVVAHLRPGGLMSQWLPVSQMPPEAIELALRTFVQVFPHTLLFRGAELELILVGSASPIDLEGFADRFYDSSTAVQDLARIGIRGPAEIASRVIRSDEQLRSRFGAGRVLSDQHNDLEHLFHDPVQ